MWKVSGVTGAEVGWEASKNRPSGGRGALLSILGVEYFLALLALFMQVLWNLHDPPRHSPNASSRPIEWEMEDVDRGAAVRLTISTSLSVARAVLAI